MDNKTRDYVTNEQLKQQLDESFAQFAKVITDAISEQLSDIRGDLRRIERHLDASLDRIDNHESRIVRLEKQNL